MSRQRVVAAIPHLLAGFLVVFVATLAEAREERVVVVEPGELARRLDLIGREVSVDDRVARFQYHPETKLFDEVFLRRCPEVAFTLPPRLRFSQSPQAPAVRLQGTFRKDGDRLLCEVAAIDLLPSDLDRLNRAISTLSKADSEKRSGWARWAERRGKAFQDEALVKRALEIESEAIRTESGRPAKDPVEHSLGLAERARNEAIPEPEPSALAHQGFRRALARVTNSKDANALISRIEAFFPQAGVPSPADSEADLAQWLAPYSKEPATAYRTSPGTVRLALDHRLWADAVQRSIERQVVEDPKGVLGLAEDAARRLPDRPALAVGLLERGLGAASSEVGTLRLGEVDTLAELYRDRLKQPEKAKELYRSWLEDQRKHRLSPRDAEGRLALALQYENLLDDRPTSLTLLRDAWAIDPQSPQLRDAFLRRGFRKVGGDWVEGPKTRAASETSSDAFKREKGTEDAESGGKAAVDEASPRITAGPSDDSLIGATPAQVLAKLSKPDRRARLATGGKLIEQWVYFVAGGKQYINILHGPLVPQPRVISFHFLPQTSSEAP